MTGACLVAPLITAILAAGLARFRPRAGRWVGVGGVAATAAAVVVLTPGGGVSLRGASFGMGGFERGIALATLAALLVASAAAGEGAARAWRLETGLLLLLLARTPTAIFLGCLAMAVALGPWPPRRPTPYQVAIAGAGLMVLIPALFFASPQGLGPAVSPATAAFLAALGLLVIAGALPFGAPFLGWLRDLGAVDQAFALGAVAPVTISAAHAVLPVLVQVVEAGRAGRLVGAFGAATMVGGALWAASGPPRELLARGLVADIGLALVALAGLDLRAAAAVLLAAALARPLVRLAGGARPGVVAGSPRVVAVLNLAGAPPTLGFAARVLVFLAALHVHPLVAAAVFAGSAVEGVAMLRLLDPGAEGEGVAPAWLGPPVAALILLGGLFPGVVLRLGWGL